jgi:tRNA 2-thiouridine synthesizing protein A
VIGPGCPVSPNELREGDKRLIVMAKSSIRTLAPKAAPRPEPVNLRGLKCPLPALKTRKLLSKLSKGEQLVIECTDPLAAIDIPNLMRETGDKLEGSSKKGHVLTFLIRKS